MLKKYLQVHPEVEAAVKEGRPVVALESTISWYALSTKC